MYKLKYKEEKDAIPKVASFFFSFLFLIC